MDIILPNKLNCTEPNSINSKDYSSIVVIGANGSEKTRFGTDIEKRHLDVTHRISAQKSLTMPEQVSTTSIKSAQNSYIFGDSDTDDLLNKSYWRWGDSPNTHLLDDYEKLLVLLHTEEYEQSVSFKNASKTGQKSDPPCTNLDKIKTIWKSVLPHRELNTKAGIVEASTKNNTASSNNYNASEMSDGERLTFYIIGAIICAPQKAIVIIDEPEIHLHKSIIKKLYDEIEIARKDCTFIYLTHDIDFAVTRQNALKIWAKSFNNDVWDYEILDDSNESSDNKLPEQLYLEILGSRNPILFTEGNESSIDYKLFQLVFSDYTIKPLGSCKKVFDTTKSFNEQKDFHQIESFGIIDRDRRTAKEISKLPTNIWVTQVAEIENILLLEDIVKVVANKMSKSQDEIFKRVKSNVIDFFDKQKETQALEHTKFHVEHLLKAATNEVKAKEIIALKEGLENLISNSNIIDFYDTRLKLFQDLIDNKNYEGILEVFNNKGIIHQSKVAELCDLNSKNNAYLNQVIQLLKQNDEHANHIRKVVQNKITKN